MSNPKILSVDPQNQTSSKYAQKFMKRNKQKQEDSSLCNHFLYFVQIYHKGTDQL
jgi:hypothetical protein